MDIVLSRGRRCDTGPALAGREVAMFGKKTLACSFCGKREDDVAKLVAGPRVYICDACVAIASRLMADPGGGAPQRAARPIGLARRVLGALSRWWPIRAAVALS